MSCCPNIVNKCLNVNPCDSAVDMDLLSTFTGILTVLVEFNGTWNQAKYSVASGDEIVLPNNFNTDYNHTIKFVLPNGSLMNDTCYCYNIKSVTGTSNTDVPMPALPHTITCPIRLSIVDTPDGSLYTLCNGTQIPAQVQYGFITIPYIIGKQVNGDIVVDNQPRQEILFNKDTGQSNTELFSGSIISFTYEQSI